MLYENIYNYAYIRKLRGLNPCYNGSTTYRLKSY